MDKFFKISERGSNVRTEIVGGITTFFAMAYIIFVNPNTLCVNLNAGTGNPDFFPAMPGELWTPVLVATCASAAIGCILTALLANVPFAQAPGMGLNAFFTYTVCLGMGYTWQEALAIVLLSGALFLIIAVSPLRSKIISSIPAFLKNAISAGIGLFIAFIGLLNVNLISISGAVPALNFQVPKLDEAGQVILDAAGNTVMTANMAGLLCLIGLLVTAILMCYKVKAAIVIGIVITTIIGFPMGVTALPESITMSGVTLAPVFLKMDFAGVFAKGILPLVTAVVSFALVDCFDTVGTLIGTATNAGMTDKRGNLPGGDRALIADAVATCCGACLGTSTVTTFVESSTGISEGARTGLSSIVVGVLFLLAILMAPVAGIIPAAATSAALIYVGVLMLMGLKNVKFDDLDQMVPVSLMLIGMPVSSSIGHAIGLGLISYTIIKVFTGKAKEVSLLTYVISALFLLKFFLIV